MMILSILFLHIDVEEIRQKFDSNHNSLEALAALANRMKETFQNHPLFYF